MRIPVNQYMLEMVVRRADGSTVASKRMTYPYDGAMWNLSESFVRCVETQFQSKARELARDALVIDGYAKSDNGKFVELLNNEAAR